MTLIDWNSAPLTLDTPEIDHTHKEFVDLVNQMESCTKADFIKFFAELYKHTEAHFNYENELMDNSGFPARAEHQAEHRKVLGELSQFKKRIDRGMVSFGQAYVRERLPEWFILHTQTMDSALAAHLKKRD